MRIIAVALSLLFFAAAPALAADPADPVYTIGPGDALEITVWQDERLNRKVVVPPDGVVSYPLIGDVKLTGLTAPALREVLAGRLKEYVPDALISVMFIEVASPRAYVIGKVNKPGMFPISLDTTVMQVLSMAGGLNPFAAPGRIIVLRNDGGKTEKIPFDYDEVSKGKALETNIVLKRGDVVVVP